MLRRGIPVYLDMYFVNFVVAQIAEPVIAHVQSDAAGTGRHLLEHNLHGRDAVVRLTRRGNVDAMARMLARPFADDLHGNTADHNGPAFAVEADDRLMRRGKVDATAVMLARHRTLADELHGDAGDCHGPAFASEADDNIVPVPDELFQIGEPNKRNS